MTILEWRERKYVSKILQEVGQRVQPYINKDSVKFADDEGEYTYSFADDKNNKIKCIFTDYKDGENYNVEFLVNGSVFQELKTSTGHYFKILSSVIEVINAFIEQCRPKTLVIDGIERDEDKASGKNKICMAYAKANIEDTDYRLGTLPHGFAIQK